MAISGNSRPVVDGLMGAGPEGFHLIGARCTGCTSMYFPRTDTCRNPDCNQGDVQETPLTGTGILYSFTVQHYQPPPLFRMDDWQPYAIGIVELEEGIRVTGMLSGVDLDGIRIGEVYQLGCKTLYTDDEGVAVTTHVFEPADKDASR